MLIQTWHFEHTCHQADAFCHCPAFDHRWGLILLSSGAEAFVIIQGWCFDQHPTPMRLSSFRADASVIIPGWCIHPGPTLFCHHPGLIFTWQVLLHCCLQLKAAFPNQQVMEIGQVGRAGLPDAQMFTFYAHSQQAPAFGDPSTLLQALQQASQSTTEVKVSTSMLPSKEAAQSQNVKEVTRDVVLQTAVRPGFTNHVLSANSTGRFGVDADFCTHAQDKPFWRSKTGFAPT